MVWVYPPQRWERDRWLIPHFQENYKNLKRLYADAGRSCELYLAPLNNHISHLVYAANLANMNTSYFSTLFKKKMGLSFVEYLQQARIAQAKILLGDPSLRVYEVAQRVGFQNEKYFMKVFKNIAGKTPSEYKQEVTST